MFTTYLEYRMMDKVHKLSDSECYTPSSEPFRFYILHLHFLTHFIGDKCIYLYCQTGTQLQEIHVECYACGYNYYINKCILIYELTSTVIPASRKRRRKGNRISLR
jgi:hypothetical protein